MEHISCSISFLIRYLKFISTPEGTDWKVSEKKQEDDTLQRAGRNSQVLKNGRKLARNIKPLGK